MDPEQTQLDQEMNYMNLGQIYMDLGTNDMNGEPGRVDPVKNQMNRG